jgi:antitoxin (DNA-binding transcriptional repressor) of toxin-antitoxin stability system
MIHIQAGHTVMMSVSQVRKQWFQLLGMIDEAGVVALLTHHGRLTFALVPFEAAQGAGIAIRKRGRPVAALVRLAEDTSQ